MHALLFEKSVDNFETAHKTCSTPLTPVLRTRPASLTAKISNGSGGMSYADSSTVGSIALFHYKLFCYLIKLGLYVFNACRFTLPLIFREICLQLTWTFGQSSPVVLAHRAQKVDIFGNKLIFFRIGPGICVESLIKSPRKSLVGILQNPRWRPK